jgi:hypothetical protein
MKPAGEPRSSYQKGQRVKSATNPAPFVAAAGMSGMTESCNGFPDQPTKLLTLPKGLTKPPMLPGPRIKALRHRNSLGQRGISKDTTIYRGSLKYILMKKARILKNILLI